MSSTGWRLPVAYRAVLLAAGLLLLGVLLPQLVTLALAVLTTVIVAIPLAAFATRLERRGIPRSAGALLGLLIALVLAGALIALIAPPLVAETRHFVDRLPASVADLRGRVHRATGANQDEIGRR